MSQSSEESRVIPAQLDFLAVYNPTFSTSDETLKDQIVYYYSRRSRSRNRKRDRDAKQKSAADTADDEANERLRQIGLAQAMVSFAKNFSDSNVDNIETDKSRIVLHELEQDWWILASIDLTRLPTSKTTSQEGKARSDTEYSAREVAPAPLVITQLARANALFLLHHATKLSDLYERVGRDTFCGLLERYWNKFVRNWDVLLHGNPATTIYNATKLSGGGELGIGVGEEEWGSGEREVLEGFIDRTEGLRDLVVGRYGLPPKIERYSDSASNTLDWLGTGNDVAAADGIIFSGKGLISKRSLRTVSQWMEAIFKYGGDAYGVRENPSSRPRPRRKRQKTERSISDEAPSSDQEVHPKLKSPRAQAPNLRKQAIENSATTPGIPAPLVGRVEHSLEQASAQASQRANSQSSKQDKTPKHEMSSDTSGDDSSAFGTDNMMKYLTLGYGTSWTLNLKGLKSDRPAEVESSTKQGAGGSAQASEQRSDEAGLQEVEPTPEASEDEQSFRQELEQSIGKFLIGLSGDLEQTELDSDGNDHDQESSELRRQRQRIFLRTLNVEMARPNQQERNPTIRRNSRDSAGSKSSKPSTTGDPKTSASASVDGPRPHITHEKVQVAVYVHQPFIFVFLFELHTPSLTMPSFYRSIHNQLGPLQKPLLRSTDPSRITERIAEGMGEKSNTSGAAPAQVGNPIYDLVFDPAKMTIRTSIPNIAVPGSLAAEGLTSGSTSSVSISGSWYTLGIPIGTSSSATGSAPIDKLVRSSWSRTEALNVHTQILNTYMATRSGREAEHTVKTSRGWWVLWMKIPPPQSEINRQINARSGLTTNIKASSLSSTSSSTSSLVGAPSPKEAFLVRKAADCQPQRAAQSRSASIGPGRWLLREQRRDVSGASSIGGSASAKGVSDGVGLDARRYVQGLLTLTQ